jgi:hypothetical protein
MRRELPQRPTPGKPASADAVASPTIVLGSAPLNRVVVVIVYVLAASLAAFLALWGIYLLVHPPEAGRWIGSVFVVVAGGLFAATGIAVRSAQRGSRS